MVNKTVDDLVNEVGNLTVATTELLDSVNVNKVELDNAVRSTSESANSAKVDAQLASTRATQAGVSANTAKAEADRAQQQANTATAVVTGGTATLKPEAGKIPIADDKGAIDTDWIPLIQAMYPHSGVIGSVDKSSLINFYGQGAGANQVELKRNQFNIAGRLVNITKNIYASLPEAESTPERAIAFDDIFLDWNGIVTPYRSITPHRTTTGYDADAIATEHGYSKVQNGLYKIGATYALLLGRIARRNKGAYHPLFNPEGARLWIKQGVISGQWHTLSEFTGDLAFFNASTANSTGYLSSTGFITDGRSGRPDNKLYDAIYADDFTPLYYSARAVIDRKALLDDSFNRAVAGETFMGTEGATVTSADGNTKSKLDSARPQFSMVDIISSLDAMPDEWKEHGIPGNWLAVGENGESLIPDGTSKNQKMSRKVLECYQVLKTSNKGTSWVEVTSTYKTAIQGATNSMGNQSFNAIDCLMIFYRTSANPFELTNRMPVSEYSNSCMATSWDGVGSFAYNILGKVTSSNTQPFYETATLTQLPVDYTNGMGCIFNTSGACGSYIYNSFVNHNVRNNPRFISHAYLSKTHMCVIYKELKHNGTKWGDNNNLDSVDNQSTVTDLNGQKVIVGHKRVQLPYHFDGTY